MRSSRRSVVMLLLGGALATPAASATTRYPPEGRHSPYTSEVVARLAQVMERGGGRPDVFAKIGDSITVHPGFLSCFSGTDVDLGAHGDLAPTMAFFGRVTVDSKEHNAWTRPSVAAHIGWSTFAAIGHPSNSPLANEISVTRPAFAVVMLGTNETYGGGVHNYERNLKRVIDETLTRGVVPIVSTIPPRRDSADLDAIVTEMNAVVRLLAETASVPLVDYHQVLRDAPGFGLAHDGIHPATFDKHPCWLGADALKSGINARNLVTLEALDRARRFLVAHDAPEEGPAPVVGAGTALEPRLIDAVPFVDSLEIAGKGTIVYALSGPRRVRINLFSEVQGVALRVEGPTRGLRTDATVDVDVPADGARVMVRSRGAGGRVSVTVTPRR